MSEEAVDWEEDDDDRQFAPRLGVGLHYLKVLKCVFGSRDSGPFQSESGHPQTMLVLQSFDGKEATLMLTLSKEAIWVTRKTCSALGNDMAAMNEAKLKPSDFALEDVCDAYLTGNYGWFNCTQGRGNRIDVEAAKPSKAMKLKIASITRAGALSEDLQAQVAAEEITKEDALETQAGAWMEARVKELVDANKEDGEEGPDDGTESEEDEARGESTSEETPFDDPDEGEKGDAEATA